jgi:outer membrane protein OmpA-like peptidoglycan-associated protein
MRTRSFLVSTAASLVLVVTAGCASHRAETEPSGRVTRRDKTVKGGAIGAAAGATTAVIAGKRAADQILIGAAIGGAVGAGVGAYMDAQEERLARIPGTHVERVEQDTLLLRFDSDILFQPDSAQLGPAARGTVEEVADVLSDYRKTAVVVQGHTDSTGPANHNLNLSQRRAETVESTLVSHGVAPQRVVASGYGETMPVATNSSERGRQLNRRVEILLKAKAS